jgi:hypothetical protein
MLKPQWDKIVAKGNKSVEPMRLYVNSGRQKGQTGTLVLVDRTSGMIQFETGNPVKIGFPRLEILDASGAPMVVHMKDMLGADVIPGSMVCYSQNSGQSSHALEIGRVLTVGKGGSLVIRPMVRNSTKAPERTTWDYRLRKEVEITRKVDSTRCLRIPVDDARLMMAMMTDFDNLGTDFNG